MILNANDAQSEKWNGHAAAHMQRVWTGIDDGTLSDTYKTSQHRHCFATNATYHASGCSFELTSSWGSAAVTLPLFGKFNISNVLSAVGTLLAEGERFDGVVKAVNAITPVPGRMEVFPVNGKASVVVDYAHTPDALEKVLLSAKFHTEGKVWCVFGCGGDRDKGKRPLMGQAAEAGADNIVITTDNSRSEAPEAIANDIKAGLKHQEKAVSIADREAAIRYCLDNADNGDIIVVAGKGHEDYQIIGNKKTNYNERAVVARLQQEYSK